MQSWGQVTQLHELLPLHLVWSLVWPEVKLSSSQEGDLAVRGSGDTVALTGQPWTSVAHCLQSSAGGIAAEAGPLSWSCSRLDPGLREEEEEPQQAWKVTPAPGRWSSRSAPMSRAAPCRDLQRRCHSWAPAMQSFCMFLWGHLHPGHAQRRKFWEMKFQPREFGTL